MNGDEKTILSILLAACMVLSLMPVTAFATDNVVADSGDSTLCEHHTQQDADSITVDTPDEEKANITAQVNAAILTRFDELFVAE